MDKRTSSNAPGFTVALGAHALALVFLIWNFDSAPKLDDAVETVPVEMVTSNDLNQIMNGEKNGKPVDHAQRRVDKVAELEDHKIAPPTPNPVKDTPPEPTPDKAVPDPGQADKVEVKPAEPPPAPVAAQPQTPVAPPAPPPPEPPVQKVETPPPVPAPPLPPERPVEKAEAPPPPEDKPQPPPDAEPVLPAPPPRPKVEAKPKKQDAKQEAKKPPPMPHARPVKLAKAEPSPPPPPPRPTPKAEPKLFDQVTDVLNRMKPDKPLDRVASLIDRLKPDLTRPDPVKPDPPKPVERPRSGNEVKEAKPRDDFNPDKITAMLSHEAPQRKASTGRSLAQVASLGSPTAHAEKMTATLQAQIDNWFIDHYNACWHYFGLGASSGYIPQVRVIVNPDGSLLSKPALLNPTTDPNLRSLADSAMRAVHECDPLPIPEWIRPHYAAWRNHIMKFDLSNKT